MPKTGNGFDRQEVFIEFRHHPGCDILQLCVPEDGLDIVVDQALMTIEGGRCPGADAIHGDIFVQETSQRVAAGRDKYAGVLLVLDLSFALFRLGMGGAGFPFLPLFAVAVQVGVNNGIFCFPFDDGRHRSYPPFFQPVTII